MFAFYEKHGLHDFDCPVIIFTMCDFDRRTGDLSLQDLCEQVYRKVCQYLTNVVGRWNVCGQFIPCYRLTAQIIFLKSKSEMTKVHSAHRAPYAGLVCLETW